MEEPDSPRELHGFKLWGYNLGYFGLYLAILLESVFMLQYYVYTINLDSILVSTGVTVQLIISAFSSIVFGVMIDNKKPGKLGKRRLFLLYALPIWFLTGILLWLPPTYCPENNSFHWPTAVFLWIVLIVKGVSGTSVLVAHASMLPEQSQTLENRKKVAAVGTILTIIASILSILIPLIVQSILADPQNVKWWDPSGQIILFYIPIVGTGFALFAVISITITFFSVDESFHKISSNTKQEKRTIRDTFQQMIDPVRDKKYRRYIYAVLHMTVSNKIVGIVIIPFITYVLLFIGPLYFIYIAVSTVCKFAWYVFWRYALKKYDLVKTASLCIAFSAIASFCELVFLIEILSFEFKIVLFVITFGTILGSIYGYGLFSGPLISALIEEAADKIEGMNKTQTVYRISGSYFGLSTFIGSIGPAIGSIIIGLILTGPNQANPMIITICLVSAGFFYSISCVYLWLIKLKKSEGTDYE